MKYKIQTTMLFILLAALQTSADRILLKSEGTIEGIIKSENDTAVVVGINIGEMSIDKKDIMQIERSGRADNLKLNKEWARNRRRQSSAKNGTADNEQRIKRGKLAVSVLTFEKSIFSKSNIPAGKAHEIPERSKAGVYYPEHFNEDKKWPIFFAMQPGEGEGISAIYSYICFADSLGFILAAPEIDSPKDDNEISRYYYVLHILSVLDDKKLINTSKVYIGGFSGGAKWALHIGAYGGDLFRGILAAGCNDDYATLGYKELKNQSCMHVPLYFLNGNRDEIAGTHLKYYQEMLESVKKTGFTTIVAKEYPGGHSLPMEETYDAFQWLLEK